MSNCYPSNWQNIEEAPENKNLLQCSADTITEELYDHSEFVGMISPPLRYGMLYDLYHYIDPSTFCKIEKDEELQLAIVESLKFTSQKNSLKFPVRDFKIQGNFISKIILLPGGLEITNSFMYNSAQTHKPLPSVCHINYYNPEFCNGFPFIISGKMENS